MPTTRSSSPTTSSATVIDAFAQALLRLHTTDAEVRSIVGSDRSTAGDEDAVLARYADAVLAQDAARRALAEALGAAPTADVSAGNTYLFTGDQIRTWQHSTTCLANPNRTQCECGLAALQGLVEPLRRKAFALTPTDVR